ncbi:hypothetical protein Psi02_53360 [Planotetraspora silvatica]|uniref:Uncharacterized protein n=1 Tax=Planotetraspora silvatica TaxID=234614 RepID=A0A8J3USB5_9ACTN|nr:inositol monophosphatase family protein [Planotetraspora silvatica]GII48912.1 hypothetical protein Psi02_53360 [Planotetraspora silvatica]
MDSPSSFEPLTAWHTVVRDGLPVALIDWTLAGPVDRLDEVVACAWWHAQLHGDTVAERNDLPDGATRAGQLRLFLDGYELPAADRDGLVDRMIEFAIRDGAPVLAALHSAPLGETYTAALGGGAFRDGVPVAPSAKSDIGVTLVATSHPPFVGRQPDAVTGAVRAMALLLPVVGAVRNFGPTSWQVADVAAGRIDALWQYGRDGGNLLAPSLVAREAGVVVTDVAGEPWRPDSDSFLAAPPALHARLLDLLSAEPAAA